MFQKKRDFFTDGLETTKFEFVPSAGTYFQVVSYKGLSEEPDTEFAKRLTRELGVASIPVSVFYHSKLDDKILRFCFAKEEATLEKAVEKLCLI